MGLEPEINPSTGYQQNQKTDPGQLMYCRGMEKGNRIPDVSHQKGNQTRKKHGLLRKNKADVAGHATQQTDQHEVKEESQRVGLDQGSNDKQRRQWCFGQ